MNYYLTELEEIRPKVFQPAGAIDNPAYSIIDIRPDGGATLGGGGLNACLAAFPNPTNDPRATLLAVDKLENLSISRLNALSNKLNVSTLTSSRFDEVVRDLLTNPPANGWKALRRNPFRGQYEIYLGGLLWQEGLNTVLASDSFGGTTGDNLSVYSSNWSAITGEDQCKIASGGGVTGGSAATSENGNRYSGITWPDDQYSEAPMATRPPTGDVWGVLCRIASGAQTYYGGGFHGFHFNDVDRIWKFVAGAITSLEALTQTFVAGDVVRLETIGSSIKLYRGGTLRGSGATDTAITSGQAGVEERQQSVNTTKYLGDWNGGDFATAAPSWWW